MRPISCNRWRGQGWIAADPESSENRDNYSDDVVEGTLCPEKDEDFVQIIMTTEEKRAAGSILLPKLADLILRSYIELPTLRETAKRSSFR